MLSFWLILPMKIYRGTHTFRERLNIDFRPTEMVIKHSGGQKVWSYSSFQSIKETPDFFYLYVDARSFFLIPQEAFEGEEERKLFQNNLMNVER